MAAPRRNGVRLYTSSYKAARSLLDHDPTIMEVDELIREGRIEHFYARDLPFDQRGEYGGWQSLWLALSDDLWYAVGDDVLGPFKTKKRALRTIGASTSTTVDTGLYEAEGYTVGRRDALVASGYEEEVGA